MLVHLLQLAKIKFFYESTTYFEVLFINDGSKDKTLEILENIAFEDTIKKDAFCQTLAFFFLICTSLVYSIISNIVIINTILQIIEIEFSAAERPASPPISSVKAGTAEPIGLKAKTISAVRASSSIGKL